MEKDKVKEQFKHIMEFCRVISKMMKSMDQVNLSGKMEKYTKGNLENQCLMAREELYIPTEKWHKENGKKTTINLFLQSGFEANLIFKLFQYISFLFFYVSEKIDIFWLFNNRKKEISLKI